VLALPLALCRVMPLLEQAHLIPCRVEHDVDAPEILLHQCVQPVDLQGAAFWRSAILDRSVICRSPKGPAALPCIHSKGQQVIFSVGHLIIANNSLLKGLAGHWYPSCRVLCSRV
jgi:hypothetical protein